MSYQVLARKWRPQLFEEVRGQKHITQTLRNALLSNRLAHAYLFTGSRGVGKTSVARVFAKAINCSNSQGGNPCNRCTSCIEITNGSSVDVQEIDGASNRGIDEIRNLRENIRYLPSRGSYRIYIIDEVHMLTIPAFNALLKTLEEPPEHVKFIFATTEPHKVPATILSRCQRFDFRRIAISEIIEQIKRITKEEEITISDSGISIIARVAGGSLRDAESLLDQVVSFSGRTVEDSHITAVLGIIDRDLIYKTSQAILDGDIRSCLEIIEDIYNYGYDIKVFYREIMGQFRNLIVSLICQEPSQLLDLPDNELKDTIKQAEHAGLERLLQSLNLLINREIDLRYTSNPRIALETILLKLSRLRDHLSFDELIEKIGEIENRLDKPLLREQSKPLETGFSKEEYLDKETSSGDGKKWNEFLRYLTTKNKAVANVLKEWKSYTITDDTLELPCGSGSFTGSYFDDPEHYEQLVAYARDFFQSDLRVVFKRQNERKRVKESSAEAKLPELLQDIVDVFEGKIVNQE